MTAAEGLIEKYRLEREILMSRLHAAREGASDNPSEDAKAIDIRDLLSEIVELDELIRQLELRRDVRRSG